MYFYQGNVEISKAARRFAKATVSVSLWPTEPQRPKASLFSCRQTGGLFGLLLKALGPAKGHEQNLLIQYTPSLNDNFSIKNEPNEIHIRTCLYVPKECRKTLKQIFYGEIFLPSKNPHICGRMW